MWPRGVRTRKTLNVAWYVAFDANESFSLSSPSSSVPLLVLVVELLPHVPDERVGRSNPRSLPL